MTIDKKWSLNDSQSATLAELVLSLQGLQGCRGNRLHTRYVLSDLQVNGK